MALVFMDGFDKYGPVNSNAAAVQALLAAEYSPGPSNSSIVAGLSATGTALFLSNGLNLGKVLAGNYGRLIGGLRFSVPASTATVGIQFNDAGSNQAGICINANGTIAVRNGTYNSGTVLGTSTLAVAANTTHYLEWDITFGNSANYQLWLDGASILSGTGDTTATANNTANALQLVTAGTSAGFTFDDLYVFDASGSSNNAPLLTSPRIETTFPNSDSAVQFGFGAAVLGPTITLTINTSGPVANSLYLRRLVPTRSCTLNAISIYPQATSATANFRPVVYADSAGVAGALMSAGSTVTGVTNGVVVTMPLTTPQSLTAGTPYWLGFMNDSSPSLALNDNSNNNSRAAVTFASGAPGAAPAMTVGLPSHMIWGNVSGTGVNFYEVNQQPPPPLNQSYVTDTVVAHEDLYGSTPLSVTPANIYGIAVKGLCAKSYIGARTVSLRCKSGATDSGGSLTGQAPGTTNAWLGSYFDTDPNTGAAWTPSALNAATCGFRIDA